MGTPVGTEAVEVNFYANTGATVQGYASPAATPIYSSGFSTMSSLGLTSFTEAQI